MPVLISFSGLPGVGKTTLARAISKEIGAVFLRIDSIEAAMKNSTLEIYPAEDAGYLAAMAVARDNLLLGQDVVADCVNPEAFTREWWRGVAVETGARFLGVELICSDMAEHRHRVETRVSDIAGMDVPDWKRVQEREYEPWQEANLLLDTATLSKQSCVELLKSRLQ